MLDLDILPADVAGGPTGVRLKVVADVALTGAARAEVRMVDHGVGDEVVSHRTRHNVVDQEDMAIVQEEVVDRIRGDAVDLAEVRWVTPRVIDEDRMPESEGTSL